MNLRKNILPSLAFIALLLSLSLFMFYLALWQVQRGKNKHTLNQSMQTSSAHTTKQEGASASWQIGRWQRHRLHLHPTRAIFISGQLRHKKTGIEVLGLTSVAHHPNIPIDLGWAPDKKSAYALLKRARNMRSVDAVWLLPQGHLLSSHPSPDTWPMQLSFLDIPSIEAHTKSSIPAILYTPESTLAILYRHTDLLQQQVLKHYNYAVQFGLFGLMGLSYAFFFTLRRVRSHAH